jgi:addiction module HigA family antidote
MYSRQKDGLPPIHPGEILGDELVELGLSASEFGRRLAVPHNRITAILKGQRAITADTALRLGRFFGMPAKVWLDLQQAYDLKRAEADHGAEINRTVRPRAA